MEEFLKGGYIEDLVIGWGRSINDVFGGILFRLFSFLYIVSLLVNSKAILQFVEPLFSLRSLDEDCSSLVRLKRHVTSIHLLTLIRANDWG